MMHEILLFTAKYLYLFVGLLTFIYWLLVRRGEKIRLIVFGTLAAIVTIILVKTGAAFYYDPRPFITHHVTPLYPHAADNGFPSDHTVLTAFIGLVIFTSSKRLGLLLLFMSALIGLSRVVGNIHSPIDIAGSFMIAFVGFLVARLLTPRVLKQLKLTE